MNGDRFEQIVEKQTRHDDWGIAVVSADQVLALLRKEHAEVLRMVKDEMVEVEGPMGRAHNQTVERILAALDMRARGGVK